MIDALQSIANWLYTGIYEFLVQFVSYLITMLTVAYLKVSLTALEFSWGVASDILQDLQFSAFLASIYSNFDNEIKDLLLWLRIPDFVSAVTTAYATRYVMRFIPFA